MDAEHDIDSWRRRTRWRDLYNRPGHRSPRMLPPCLPPAHPPDLPPWSLVPQVTSASLGKSLHCARELVCLLVRQRFPAGERRVERFADGPTKRFCRFFRTVVPNEPDLVQCQGQFGCRLHERVDIRLSLIRSKPHRFWRDTAVTDLHDVHDNRFLEPPVYLAALIPAAGVARCDSRPDLPGRTRPKTKRVRHVRNYISSARHVGCEVRREPCPWPSAEIRRCLTPLPGSGYLTARP